LRFNSANSDAGLTVSIRNTSPEASAMFRSPLATVARFFSTVRNPLTLVTSATSASVSTLSASAREESFCAPKEELITVMATSTQVVCNRMLPPSASHPL